MTKLLYKPEAKTRRVRGYVRVSHVGDRDLVSDHSQLDEIKRLCDLRGWEFGGGVADLDVSAYRLGWRHRPQLVKLYEEAQRGEFDLLVIYKLDRFGRSVKDSLDCWEAFAQCGVAIYSVYENIDFSTDSGMMIRNIMLSLGEMESKGISARVMSAYEHMAAAGTFRAGVLPQWITKDEEGRNILNEPVASGVRRICQLRLDGHSFASIMRTINTEGFRTARGGLWSTTRIMDLCKPHWVDTLLGHGWFRREGRYKTDRTTGQRVTRGTPVMIPNMYPPVIDETTGAQMKAMAEAVKDRHNPGFVAETRQGRYSASANYLLSSAIWCAECGSRMTSAATNGSRGHRLHYKCGQKLLKADQALADMPHTARMVERDIVEDAVMRVVRLYWQDIDLPQATAKPKTVKAPAKRSVADVDREIDRLSDLYARNIIKEADFVRKYEKLTAERESLQTVETERLDAVQLLNAIGVDDPDADITRPQMRQMLLSLVERIEYPVYVDGVTQGNAKKNMRPCARVILRAPVRGHRTWLAPVYRRGNGVPRTVIAEEG